MCCDSLSRGALDGDERGKQQVPPLRMPFLRQGSFGRDDIFFRLIQVSEHQFQR
jgi:hypothetical protein